jgi:DNA-binding CsgD family transcriptional regulator
VRRFGIDLVKSLDHVSRHRKTMLLLGRWAKNRRRSGVSSANRPTIPAGRADRAALIILHHPDISPASFPPSSRHGTLDLGDRFPMRLCIGTRSPNGDVLGGRFKDLTDRERECLFLATRFMRPKEIAAQIGGSPRTVETHLTRAAVKIGASTPREAAKMYAEHLSQFGSGNTPTETTRLSDSLTDHSSSAPQKVAEQPTDDAVREHPATLLGKPESNPLQGPFAWPWKGIKPDDMTITQMLAVILAGAILAAVALIITIAMADAFDRLASILTRRP